MYNLIIKMPAGSGMSMLIAIQAVKQMLAPVVSTKLVKNQIS